MQIIPVLGRPFNGQRQRTGRKLSLEYAKIVDGNGRREIAISCMKMTRLVIVEEHGDDDAVEAG